MNTLSMDMHNNKQSLIGMDISDAHKKLGYWYTLTSQHVTISGGVYTFERSIHETVTLRTDEHNKVIAVERGGIAVHLEQIMRDTILHTLDRDAAESRGFMDAFIVPNQYEVEQISQDPHLFFSVIGNLIAEGVIRRRNCEGVAYEYNR